jgi:LacI family transcriptional regulator
MPRIKDIAARANVSIGTVDRVLHGRGRVSKTTEARIRRIVEETNYHPNIFARNLKLDKTFVFGVLMPKPSQDSSFWTLPMAGINRAVRELAAQRIAVRFHFYDKYSASSFEKVSREILRSRLDGLLIAPVLSKAFESFVSQMRGRLPFVFFDSFIPGAGYLSAIGQDAFQSGIVAGRLMQLIVPPDGRIAVLRAVPSDYHIEDRIGGFLTYCRRKCGHDTPVFDFDSHESPAARRKTLRRIAETEGLRGIFVTNASTHQASALRSDRERGETGVRIIGYDLIEDNVRCLREGSVDFLISQRPERQGYEGILALYRAVVLKAPVAKSIMMPIDIVTRESVDHYRD